MASIVPALLRADFAHLGKALDSIKAAGASRVHLDVMDGHFAPEVSFGEPMVRSLRRSTGLELELHLLIERPERYVKDLAAAGGDRISIHAETTPRLHHALRIIHDCGAKAGVVLNPGTAVGSVVDVLKEIDVLTVLSADFLAAEEQFLPHAIAKVAAAARLRAEQELNFKIEVEGGIGLHNQAEAVRVGADILVIGSAIFDHEDPEARLREFVELASAAPASA